MHRPFIVEWRTPLSDRWFTERTYVRLGAALAAARRVMLDAAPEVRVHVRHAITAEIYTP